jgi:putative membrane protein
MTVSGLLFWGLMIAGIVALVHYAGRSGQPGHGGHPGAKPQHVLADRFAPGEIDEEEYTPAAAGPRRRRGDEATLWLRWTPAPATGCGLS